MSYYYILGQVKIEYVYMYFFFLEANTIQNYSPVVQTYNIILYIIK